MDSSRTAEGKRSRAYDDDRHMFGDENIPMLDCDDNWMGELTQDFVEATQQSWMGELTQEFVEASQYYPEVFQIGQGLDNGQGTSDNGTGLAVRTSTVNVEDALTVTEQRRRRCNKYGGEEVIYRARVDPNRLTETVRNRPAHAIVDVVRQLFQLLLVLCTRGLRPTDLIRICLQASGLDRPISTTLMTVSALSVEKVMAAVMKVLQSKEEIHLDSGFVADVVTIRRDIGAGRRKLVNVEVDRLKKQSILAIPSDDVGLCCAKAIVYALAHLDKDVTAIKAMQNRRRPALMKRATALHNAAGVPLGPCTYAEVAQFEEHLNVQIVVFSSDNLNKVSYKGQSRPKRINLWLHNGHFDVIKSLSGFHGSSYYCEACEKPFQCREKHYCPTACPICQRTGCTPTDSVRCSDCDRLCRSKNCYDAHKAVTGKQQFSLCDIIHQCRDCKKILKGNERVGHICGSVKCPSCEHFVMAEEHRCHLRVTAAKAPSEKLIFFDFETDQESGEHVVNLAVAQYFDGTEMVFKGYDACAQFCSWLFAPVHKGCTAIAHNMKGFDGQFILGWILEQGTAPEVIPCGSKIMSIIHKSLGVRVIDSFNFLPMGLAKMPACFGFSELKKGYFPHYFNIRANQNYVGPLPPIQFYGADSMATKTREEFLKWHEEHKNQEFDFQKEILEYCRSDVDILRRCCVEFRSQFLDVTGVDPFQYITIASACMATYRSKRIQPDTIAMIPVQGYTSRVKYSVDSIKWLDYVASKENIYIQHAQNGNGERKIGGVSVDGYCADTNTVYQYQGCFYHGCLECYDPDMKHPLKGITMAAVYEASQRVMNNLRLLGYTVIEMWEHTFALMQKENPEVKAFAEAHHLQPRLNPKDAFFGGRTNAVKLYHEGPAKYVDFTSLYPWVNKYCRYPVGHPVIITENFRPLEDYFGIVKCRVVPPRGLYLPVLPYRCKEKLMFPLCRTCAETLQQTSCGHTEEERAIVGTWVTEEVKVAVQKGYRITHMYEVYHFKKSSDSLFRSYIDLFLKIKQESSGWPGNCVSEEDKQAYVQQYLEKEGVSLDRTKILKNPGRRQVAKLALNSFWGRWGMNLNKPRLTYVNTVEDFNKHLADPKKNIKDIYFPTEEIAALQWDNKKELIHQDANTNIFIAAFTTAWARLKLYGEMDKLGDAVLYHDTDSIIYASTGANDLPVGRFLGEFTDEMEGDVITTFVSGTYIFKFYGCRMLFFFVIKYLLQVETTTLFVVYRDLQYIFLYTSGPKNYAYQTAGGQTSCKVRGFTLNWKNSTKLNFDSVKEMVCSMDPLKTITLQNFNIRRDPKRRKVTSKEELKVYRVVYNKRALKEDLSTVPYGY